MALLDPNLRKEISHCFHKAIDNDLLHEADKACNFYVEGISLVTEVLKKNLSCQDTSLSLQDKCKLVKYAEQGLGRISLLLGLEKGLTPDGAHTTSELPLPSAPLEINFDVNNPQSVDHLVTEYTIMMARYQHRLGLASNALDQHNIKLEMARNLAKKVTVTRMNLARATAWALQKAYKKFQIQEKLANGHLKESDLRKQQLYTVSYQFNDGNTWLGQLLEEITVYPNNEKATRELLDVMLIDNSHPIKATINQMQEKILRMISEEMKSELDHASKIFGFDVICKVIKEDISIIQDVLKALFEPLKTDFNCILTNEAIHHVYFSQIKLALITLIKTIHENVEHTLEEKMKTDLGAEDLSNASNECINEAVSKLHYITTLHSPYSMVDCAVQVIKLIATSSFDNEHSTTSIGADVLLPRICKVVLASGRADIFAESYFMDAFMPSEKALGEEGYAVTILQSAIAHLAMS